MTPALEVRTEIANESAAAQTLTLRTVLETADGREVLRGEQAVGTRRRRELAQVVATARSEERAALASGRSVSAFHPHRSDRGRQGGATACARGSASGCSRCGCKDGLFVNKKFIGVKLNGVNRHQDYAYVGNALPNSGQWRDVKLLREGGVNMVRAAHYPQDPAFYDACDELGMLVTTANPGWQFFNDKDPDLRAAHL